MWPRWPPGRMPPEGWQAPDAVAYARVLADSFRRLTGRPILGLPDPADDAALAAALYAAPFPLVSHGTEADPVFRYGNAAALRLWEMGWDAFTRLPSRQSAEPDPEVQADRDRLLAEARERGWTEGYRGIRISAGGRRFRILDTILWTVTDAEGRIQGQAARIGRVEAL